MESTSQPALISVPFADQGSKNVIPVSSQIGITDGAASFTDGFPPLTMTPIAAGGIPPAGGDFNGILNAITQSIRWSCAGGQYSYSSDFATTVGGYPLGSVLLGADLSSLWLSTEDNNSNDPSSGTGWVPFFSYGITSLGLAESSVTLTAEQAAKKTIILSGTLTANLTIYFPSWVMSWIIVNNTTGSFTISAKTSAGTGVNLAASSSNQIYCDGTNIYYGALMVGNNLAEIKAAGTNSQVAARGNIGCGTVAPYDITTSTTDSTVGHVLKVGDHGVGNDALLAVDTALSSPTGCPSGFFKQSGNDADNRYGSYGTGVNLQYAVTEDEGTYYGRVFVRHDGHLIAEWIHVNTDGTIAEQYVNELYGALNKPTATDTGALPITGGNLLGQLGFVFQDAREDADCSINHLDANGATACRYGYYQDRFDIHFYDDDGHWESNPLSIGRNGNVTVGGNLSGAAVFEGDVRVYSPNNPQDMSAYITSSTANGKFVTGVRLGANMSTHWGSEGGTAPAGCALTGGDFGDGDSYPYYAYMQYCVSGTWINASGGVGAENMVSANHYQAVPDGTISLLTNLRPYLRGSNHLPGLVGVQRYIDDNGYDWFEAAPKLAGAVFIAVAPESGVIVQIADSSLPDTDAFSLYPSGVTVAGLDSLPEGCTIDGTWKFDAESRTVSQDADLAAALALTKNTQLRAQYAATATLNIGTLQAGIAINSSVDGDSDALTAWQGYLCDLRAMTTEDLQQSPTNFPVAPASVF